MTRFAAVHPVYNAYCADCAEGAGPFDDEDEAQRWAEKHNAQYHPDPKLVNDVVALLRDIDSELTARERSDVERNVALAIIERVNQP